MPTLTVLDIRNAKPPCRLADGGGQCYSYRLVESKRT